MGRIGAWLRGLLHQEPVVAEEAAVPVEWVEEGEDTERSSTPAQGDDLETPALRSVDPGVPATGLSVPEGPRTCGASMRYGWVSDVGRVREHNEDSVFIFASEQCSTSSVPPFGLFILADGMGGHDAGEVASAVACQTVAMQLMEHAYLPLLYGEVDLVRNGDDFTASLGEILTEAIQRADMEVYNSTPGSGTTLTCALFIGRHLLIGHVGDSRAYLRQGGGAAELLTNDHSMVKQLVDIGQLTPEAAAVHPRRNILYRAVGQGGALAVDVRSIVMGRGAQLLLCTDGMWGLVPDVALWEILDSAPSTQAACESLAAFANEAGGNDNITAIVVEFRDGSA